jgi:hypothetical protein
MKTKAFVDLLRNTLAVNGHVLAKHQSDSSRFLNHGEYLVSLLSNDGSLYDLLWDDCSSPDFRKKNYITGSHKEGWTFRGLLSDEFGSYVETVKFLWILHGTSATLSFIREGGYDMWVQKSYHDRDRYTDSLVFIAQKRLRISGLKYSDFAEFFADPKVVKLLRGTV